ncbi:MAG TPA: RNA degradosome polyphosphate kinase [Glycomyces sp.]|nr:RNA degradosome polyphosphate kinase [Glycomyces sp.]
MTNSEPAPLAEANPPPDRFLDREESWLRFNGRVLRLAQSPELPLLERVRFLSIFSSNLDEFFMVRVAGLMRRLATGLPVRTSSGRRPQSVLKRIEDIAHRLSLEHARCFREEIAPLLAAEGIEILRWEALEEDERRLMRELFHARIHPVLTPLVVDPAHPFPYISGQSLNLAVQVRDPRTGAMRFARVKVPPPLPRFLAVAPGRFVPLEDVIASHLGQLFGGMDVVARHTFRVTRNQDLEIDEDITENLLQTLERELLRRRFGPVVRLEVEDTVDPVVLDRLTAELGVDAGAVHRLPGPLDLSGLHAIADLERPELQYPPFRPSEAALPPEADLFAVIRDQDILVHHPYDSFTASVERLIEEAAADPQVLAIKQTLYRTSGKSPIVDALIGAAEAGKQVVVVVEIKARFDEQANIDWAQKLEQAGCHVMYGIVGLKTHCKLALVVRQEDDGSLLRYSHIGTGNYHPKTARLYEDFGLLTTDRAVGEDVNAVFNHLTGYSRSEEHQRLLVAPHSLRPGLIERIEREIANHRAGLPAGIRFKCNALTDMDMIDALYDASRAGVPVDLLIRGICALRPGVPGLSENIRVRSVLGRFLEHSRVYVFANAGDPEVWLGSADLMHRNLDRRVEVLVRVSGEAHRDRLASMLERGMDGDARTWRLGPLGLWSRPPEGVDLQEEHMREHRLPAVTGVQLHRPEIFAAGAVLWRRGEHETEVALVHRPKYDDWSFPKGKRKKGEHPLAAAQREVFEETGVRPVLGRPLAPSFYDKEGRLKRVDYWCATAASEAVAPAADPSEVDGMEWTPLSEARDRLTHERDRPVLEEFAAQAERETVPFVFVRHAVALSKADWFDRDELRPLNRRGRERAAQLEVLLSGYAIEEAYSATSARCLETLLPYCAARGVPLAGLPEFTPGTDEPGRAAERIDRLLAARRPAVLCGHGETVHELAEHLCRRLGAAVPGGPPLGKGSFLVFHTAAGRVVAAEHHD